MIYFKIGTLYSENSKQSTFYSFVTKILNKYIMLKIKLYVFILFHFHLNLYSIVIIYNRLYNRSKILNHLVAESILCLNSKLIIIVFMQ